MSDGLFQPGGWYDPAGMYQSMYKRTPFYFSRRMRWKPWRYEVCERVYDDWGEVVIKRDLTLLGAKGFIKLLGE